jgi:TolA-binding protein
MEVFMCAIARFTRKTATFTFLLLLGASAAFALGEDDKAPDRGSSQSAQSVSSAEGNQNEISELRRQLADQQRQIEELRVMVYQQAKRIDNGGGASSPSNEASTSSGSGAVGQVASMVPMLPSASSPVTTPVAAVKQTTGQASAPKSEVPAWVRGYKPILLFYLSYQAGTRDLANRQTIDYNAFLMKRGYFGADINITPYLTSRFVGDVYLNSVGDEEVRAK